MRNNNGVVDWMGKTQIKKIDKIDKWTKQCTKLMNKQVNEFKRVNKERREPTYK